jgi:Cys-tRNA synthase (O-phospho-L-seryl-tRNA:Cys-tRNA synthase)
MKEFISWTIGDGLAKYRIVYQDMGVDEDFRVEVQYKNMEYPEWETVNEGYVEDIDELKDEIGDSILDTFEDVVSKT